MTKPWFFFFSYYVKPVHAVTRYDIVHPDRNIVRILFFTIFWIKPAWGLAQVSIFTWILFLYSFRPWLNPLLLNCHCLLLKLFFPTCMSLKIVVINLLGELVFKFGLALNVFIFWLKSIFYLSRYSFSLIRFFLKNFWLNVNGFLIWALQWNVASSSQIAALIDKELRL